MPDNSTVAGPKSIPLTPEVREYIQEAIGVRDKANRELSLIVSTALRSAGFRDGQFLGLSPDGMMVKLPEKTVETKP